MKITNKTVGRHVDVCDRDCPRRPCYWPRPVPGAFTQGQGYRQRSEGSAAGFAGIVRFAGVLIRFRSLAPKPGTAPALSRASDAKRPAI